MAFVLCTLNRSLLPQSKFEEKPIHQKHSLAKPSSQQPLFFTFFSPLSSTAQVPGAQEKHQQQQQQKNKFYVNLGLAVRTLREDMPLIFIKDLNYDIYRDDITYKDPLDTFNGIENYKLIFWALRFHCKILFREIALDVYRIWQPSENVILITWKLRGGPRVPYGSLKGDFRVLHGINWTEMEKFMNTKLIILHSIFQRSSNRFQFWIWLLPALQVHIQLSCGVLWIPNLLPG